MPPAANLIVDRNFGTPEQLANRCAILIEGRKMFDAPPAEIAAQPGLRPRYFRI